MLSEGELHVQAMRLVCDALADREKHGEDVQWDVLQQMLDHMDTILQGIADQRSDDAEEIETLRKDRDHWRQARQDAIEAGELMKAEIETLRQQLSADAVRQELESLKAKNAELLAKLATVENAAATENERLREQLAEARAANLECIGTINAARAEAIEARRRLNEETDRHRKTNAEKIELFEQKEWANQHAVELVRERDAALATVDLQRAGIELLNAFVGKVRSVMDRQYDGVEFDDISRALAELDGEPAPETEPARCPECERWQRAQRINSELLASKAKEIERLNAFVGKVRSVVDNDCDGLEIDEMIKALDELDAGTSEPEDGQ